MLFLKRVTTLHAILESFFFFFSGAVGKVNIGELNVKLDTVACPVEEYLVHIWINRVFQLTWLNIYHILDTPNYTFTSFSY